MYIKAVGRFYAKSLTSCKFLGARHLSDNESHIVRCSRPDIEIPNATIPEFLSQRWSTYPNRIALECFATGKKYTFEQVRKKSSNLCEAFKKKYDLKKGDVVAILLPNTPDYGVCILGALKAGLIVTTLTPLATVDDVIRQIVETEAKALITFPMVLAAVPEEIATSGFPIISIKFKPDETLPAGVTYFDELLEDLPETTRVQVDPSDVAILPCSSGTTGLPKAVELTHRNIVANILQFNKPAYDPLMLSTDSFQPVGPGLLPFFHVAGLVTLLFKSLYHMGKLITMPQFQPDIYIKLLELHKPHYLVLVPYIANFLSSNANVKKEHFERVQLIASSAAPLSLQDEERLLEKVGNGIDVVQGYGMTEASALITLAGRENGGPYKCSGSVGTPLQNTLLKVVDESGKALGPNQSGEILIKGPQIMKGYLKKPDQTRETFMDGWLKSGDIGYYDDHSNFFITERLKELIKVKGYQVAPAELEAIIRNHPQVVEAAVIGIPHETYGEVPRAYVVLKGKTDTKADEIQDFVAQKVANYKHIKGGVEFIDAIPKALSGKILRTKLKNDFLNNE